MSLPFQGIRTFCKTYHSLRPQTEFVVLGMPVDCATTFRSGARMGPAAIRAASMMLTDGVCAEWPVDIVPHVTDLGDLSLSTGNSLVAVQQIQNVMAQLQSGEHHVVSLGGDHMITLGILRAMKMRYTDLACVHLDAHCDTWSSHGDQPMGHGTWMFNAINEGLINPRNTISVGVRSAADDVTRNWLQDRGGETFSARRAVKYSARAMADIISARVGDKFCYLTLDIDCLDPAYAPGTGTPEISGLSTMWVEELIDALSGVKFVGMDCVEVAPAYDHGEITALAAATFCWRYLSQRIHIGSQAI